MRNRNSMAAGMTAAFALTALLLAALAEALQAQPKACQPSAAADLTPRFPPGTRIVFQGDSITEGGRGYGDDPNHIFGQDYAYLIAARCGAHYADQNWTFLNRGVSGNKVADLAGRWQSDALNLKPDILSILVGVNDVNSVVSSGGSGGVTAQHYEQVYDQILQQARAANPNIQVCPGRAVCRADRACAGKSRAVERGNPVPAGGGGTAGGEISCSGRSLPENV